VTSDETRRRQSRWDRHLRAVAMVSQDSKFSLSVDHVEEDPSGF